MYWLTELVILTLVSVIASQYTPPQAKVEPIYPKGFRISIPDEQGISLVAYHIKFNEEFDGLEAGTIAKDVLIVRQGRWYLGTRDIQLKPGDIIHYWVHVVYNGLGYNLLNQQHLVTDFYDLHGRKVLVNTNANNENNKNKKDCVLSSTQLINLRNRHYEDTCEGELLFYDDFETFNATAWRTVEQFSKAPDYPFVVYRNRELNVKVKRGQLLLIPTLMETEFGRTFIRRGDLTLEKCTGEVGTSDCHRQARGFYILPPVSSGYVDTKNSFAFLYGTVEIRAKLPKGDWIYPVISLEPIDNAEDEYYPQLRIAASAGNTVLRSNGGTDLSGHVLSGGGIQQMMEMVGRSAIAKRFANNFWSDDYHIYRIEWTKFRISVKVDGVEYGTTRPGAPFDKPFYIALGVAVGGHKEFPDMCESESHVKPWRNAGSKASFEFYNATDLWARTWENDAKDLAIDYVKVWAI